MRRRRAASSTQHAAWVTLCCCAFTLALAADPRDHADCGSCVAAGYGWSPTKGKCGGFKNKACPDPAPQPDPAAERAAAEAEAAARAQLEQRRAAEEAARDAEAAEAARAARALAEFEAAEARKANVPSHGAEQPGDTAQEEDGQAWVGAGVGWDDLVQLALALRLPVALAAVGCVTFFLTARAARRLRSQGSASGSAEGRVELDVRKILFTQATIEDTFRDGRSVQAMIEELQAGRLTLRDIPPIRVVRKHGKYFTLDHRRLYAMREALGDRPKPQRTVSCVRETFADDAIVAEFKRKATTDNPRGITLKSTWLADWKPFVEGTPTRRRAGWKPADADVSNDDMAAWSSSPQLRRRGGASPRTAAKAAAAAGGGKSGGILKHLGTAAETAMPQPQPEPESESESSEEEPSESSEEEEEPTPAPAAPLSPLSPPSGAKAPEGFTPTFSPPTVATLKNSLQDDTSLVVIDDPDDGDDLIDVDVGGVLDEALSPHMATGDGSGGRGRPITPDSPIADMDAKLQELGKRDPKLGAMLAEGAGGDGDGGEAEDDGAGVWAA